MRLPEICIRRPVFATVMSLMLTLVGAVAYDRLTVREYPRIEEPVVTVRTDYPGASAEIIESQVTQPLEESLAGIEGIDFMNSISRPEESQITIQFNINRDPDIASNDVRDRVARARRSLPDDVDEPVVAKREADAQPIIWMSLESDRHSSLELSDAADRIVKDRLQSLPGISEIRIFGERRYAMRVWVDPVRLAAYGLTVQDVETALRAQNVEIPAGRIESSDREFTVLAETDLRSQTAFEDIVLRETDGYPVRISDVGRVEVDAQDKRVAFRINGKTGVGVGVIKQSTANPLEVSTAIRQELPSVSDSLPDGMKLKIAYDTSIFIERSIYAVVESILIAVLLVVLVIFVFLRSVRATLIPVVTIPVSMISTFALMYLFGFSINTLTLLAFVLAVGLVVDDAIVMLENIHRHIEEGMKPFAAAIKGSKEIAFACIAMTLTLAAVYAPVSFQTGRTGRLFAEFALTLAGAVLVSGFVALSLSPMMCSKLLRHQDKHNFLYRAVEFGTHRPDWRLSPAAGPRSLRLAGDAGHLYRPRRHGGGAVPQPAQRDGADRGPWQHHRHRLCAGRIDPRIHGPLCAADRKDPQRDKGHRELWRRAGQSHRHPRRHVPAAAGLGCAGAQAAGHHGGGLSEAARAAGRHGLRQQSAIAGPVGIRPADLAGGADDGVLRGPERLCAADPGSGAQEPLADKPAQRSRTQQAGDQDFRRPGQGRRPRPRCRRGRPHAGDHARRPPGDALQICRQAVRCDRANRRR